ncbi:hypothetical protein EV05_0706 [Prochlorococcus sp. MIT 0601]|nr:hypothetical protein EV05_0706 [Prochlorococcus sp. MIT 0601]
MLLNHQELNFFCIGHLNPNITSSTAHLLGKRIEALPK